MASQIVTTCLLLWDILARITVDTIHNLDNLFTLMNLLLLLSAPFMDQIQDMTVNGNQHELPRQNLVGFNQRQWIHTMLDNTGVVHREIESTETIESRGKICVYL